MLWESSETWRLSAFEHRIDLETIFLELLDKMWPILFTSVQI